MDVKAMKVLTILLALLLIAPPALSQVPDDKLIVPGERIGSYKLGMPLAEVISVFGSPGERQSTTMPNSYGLSWKERGMHFSFFSTTHTVSGISLYDTVENRTFRTADGLAIGSPVGNLDRFGKPEWKQQYPGGVEARAYWAVGLYTQSKEGRLIVIGVFDNKTR